MIQEIQEQTADRDRRKAIMQEEASEIRVCKRLRTLMIQEVEAEKAKASQAMGQQKEAQDPGREQAQEAPHRARIWVVQSVML